VGSIDAGNFKGAAEIENLSTHVKEEAERYVAYMKEHGHYAEAFTKVGTDVIDEIENIVNLITAKFPNVVFFGGQIVFPEDSFITRWLHNYIVFAVQRKFYKKGIPFVILPIRV
jgi:N-dimethylarginine dimethylaminohydrolase